MAANRSTAFINEIASNRPYYHLKKNARVRYYSGARPASADLAPTGTLLCTFTKSAGTYTAETRATAVLVLSAFSATASIDTLTVGGGIPLIGTAVSSATTLAALCNSLAAAINAYDSFPKFTATTNGTDTVTISAPKGLGARANGLTIAVTDTNVTTTINGGSSAAFGGTGSTAGVTCANGCDFQYPSVAGVLTKETTVWQGVANATGTVGYARIEYDGADDQSNDSTNRLFSREDLTVGTSGADMIVGTTTITAGRIYSIDDGTFSVPAA